MCRKGLTAPASEVIEADDVEVCRSLAGRDSCDDGSIGDGNEGGGGRREHTDVGGLVEGGSIAGDNAGGGGGRLRTVEEAREAMCAKVEG